MVTTVYADILFFVNFSMDFISIWAASRLCSLPGRAGRMCLGAALGALYGVFAVIFDISGIFAYISAAAVSALMCLVSFGLPSGLPGLLRESAVIWGGGALLGGLMTAFLSIFSTAPGSADGFFHGGNTGIIIAMSLGALYITVRLMTRTKAAKTVTVTLSFRGERITFTALCDSGNLLRDPISGDPVMTVSSEVLMPVWGREFCSSLCDLNTNPHDIPRGFRLIPRKTASGSDICAAFLPDSITLDNKGLRVRCLVSAARCPKNHFAGYPAVFPADILR